MDDDYADDMGDDYDAIALEQEFVDKQVIADEFEEFMHAVENCCS